MTTILGQYLGQMANFPAVIIMKVFDLENHHVPQNLYDIMQHTMLNKSYTYVFP